jgi:hypothetical protein
MNEKIEELLGKLKHPQAHMSMNLILDQLASFVSEMLARQRLQAIRSDLAAIQTGAPT